MKVLYLVTTPRPFFTNQVQVLQDRGVDIQVLQVPGRELMTDSRKYTDYFKYYSQVLQEQANGYDLVHANYGNTCPFAVFQPKRPIVVTYWGSDLMGRLGTLNSTFANLFDKTILPSPVLAEHLNSYFGSMSFFPSIDYSIIPFGIDADKFRPMPKEEAQEELGWETDSKIALFPYNPGREVKNFNLAKRIIDEINDVELRIMSEVAYEDVPVYMNASDVVLITSDRESGPMVIKEAALCNVPVVSTDVGFAKEVLSEISNSYVCKTDSDLIHAVRTVLDNGPHSDGRTHLVEDVSLEKMGDHLINVYRDVLE